MAFALSSVAEPGFSWAGVQKLPLGYRNDDAETLRTTLSEVLKVKGTLAALGGAHWTAGRFADAKGGMPRLLALIHLRSFDGLVITTSAEGGSTRGMRDVSEFSSCFGNSEP